MKRAAEATSAALMFGSGGALRPVLAARSADAAGRGQGRGPGHCRLLRSLFPATESRLEGYIYSCAGNQRLPGQLTPGSLVPLVTVTTIHGERVELATLVRNRGGPLEEPTCRPVGTGLRWPRSGADVFPRIRGGSPGR